MSMTAMSNLRAHQSRAVHGGLDSQHGKLLPKKKTMMTSTTPRLACMMSTWLVLRQLVFM
jgi:hypothetical protein